MFNIIFHEIHASTMLAAKEVDASRANSLDQIKVQKVFTEAQNLERVHQYREGEEWYMNGPHFTRDPKLHSFDPISRFLIGFGRYLLPHRYFYDANSDKLQKVCDDLESIVRSDIPVYINEDEDLSNGGEVYLEVVRLKTSLASSRNDGFEIVWKDLDHGRSYMKITLKDPPFSKIVPIGRSRSQFQMQRRNKHITNLGLQEALIDLHLARIAGLAATVGLSYLLYKNSK